MKHYTIPNLPEEIDEILYDWQRAAILKKLESPIVTVTEKDPIWAELDDQLVAANNILSLSKSGEVECSVHELLPGVNAVWIMDDTDDGGGSSPAQAILINGLDLESLREGGMDGLIQHHLFKGF
jgi:hypothetical protein